MAIFGQNNQPFWIFQRIPLLLHSRRHMGEDFRKFSAETIDKIEVISQKPSKTGFLAKMTIFWHFLAKNIPNFESPHGNYYSNTLVDT